MAYFHQIQAFVPKDQLMQEIETRIGHKFRNKELLRQALTHSSATKDKKSYERLEFLGDRILSFVVADLLFVTFPDEEEGALAKRHSALVKQGFLENVALKMELQKYMIVSEKIPSASMLADVIEALIAALYLDAGFDAAATFIRAYWLDMIASDIKPPEDSKSALQEWAQARGLPLPEYTVLERTGPDHRPSFVVQVRLAQFPPQQAPGTTKQIAEKLAAQLLLNLVREEDAKR